MACSEVIKTATKGLHAEAELALIRRIHGIKSIEDYNVLLASFVGFFSPVERLVGKFLHSNILPDIDTRRKTSNIIKSCESGTCTKAAAPSFLPAVTSLPQAFGAMYVLEGSTLGGKTISRMLQANVMVQLSSESLSFFNVYGESTFEMWIQFKSVMDARLVDDTDINAAINTAGETFSKMRAWMQKTSS